VVNYELALVYRVKKTGEIDKESVAKIFEKFAVKVNKADEWPKRKLAYEIDSEKEGVHIFYDIDCDGSAVKDLCEAFRLNSAVLKYLFLKDKKDPVSEGAA